MSRKLIFIAEALVAFTLFTPNCMATQPQALREKHTIEGAPVATKGVCERNLKDILEVAVESDETILKSECVEIDVLNSESEEFERQYQPTAIVVPLKS